MVEWLQRPLDADPALVADLRAMPVGDALATNLERSGFYASTDATVGGAPGIPDRGDRAHP